MCEPAVCDAAGRKKPPDLSVVQVHSTSIPPRECVTYAKQTQTASSGPEQSCEWAAQGGERLKERGVPPL